MLISLCIIAKDESATIAKLIQSVAAQSLLHRSCDFEFVVICNGCSDNTAEVAQRALENAFGATSVAFRVHDAAEAGKARSWNLAVHQILNPAAETIIFMDADIHIADTNVLADLATKLSAGDDVAAVSGWPVKDIALKPNKSIIDRFSLRISSQTPAPHSVNGSLYAVRADHLKNIWLPVPTPGEDGFLSAMIHTDGFSHPARLERIQRADRPTHYFEAHSVMGFFRHERRMTIGTTINGWICEKMWAGNHSSPAGPVIRDWNENEPMWVSKLVSSKVAGRFWALPPRLLTWRLHNLRGVGLAKALTRAPFSIVATLLNIWPCIQANRALKRQGSAHIW
jgi:glycosyltransferase involved in cell wall biosynthesis